MEKKKVIRSLEKRIEALEKIVKSNSITLTDPTDQEASIVMEVEDGQFTSYTCRTSKEKSNLTQTPL